jgi:Asp-tRNA(Asn)/Glu-tRNA(Gln) amidotransferase A subunit family amidase
MKTEGITGDELLNVCLGRIAESDRLVRAWVVVDPQPALADGPLRGIPFGAKDVFDTAGMPTEFGSPLFAGRRAARDAAMVHALRSKGAVLLGKTHTSAFASFDPAPTANPKLPGHTPGGSSSGSAAAVAAGMAPFAIGTQTLGSVLRPASYCGVCGFKPTYGRISMEGVLPFAPSLDTVGLFTATAGEMKWLWERSFGSAAECAEMPPIGTAEVLPEGWDELVRAAFLINEYEGARTHRALLEQQGGAVGGKLADLLRRGWSIGEADYVSARRHVERMRGEMARVFEDYPLIVTPAAEGPAPAGLDGTGDPSPNAPWTALGVPAISIPVPDSLVGLQMVAAWDRDDDLIAAAACMTPPRV